MRTLVTMMNMTPQELNSYIVQNHAGSQHSDYLYSNHSGVPTVQYAHHHHHPLSVGSGGCASSQPSSDEDLTFYNASAVTHPISSHSLSQQQSFV
jgi:hypothetical protein